MIQPRWCNLLLVALVAGSVTALSLVVGIWDVQPAAATEAVEPTETAVGEHAEVIDFVRQEAQVGLVDVGETALLPVMKLTLGTL